MDEIRPGDVVQLRSGGPNMTVTAVEDHYGTPSAWCVWFEKNKNHNGTFALVAVKKV